MEERGHILNVLNKVIKALKQEDYLEIKFLSNQMVHNSSINQDPDSISVAVVIYSLSKMIERENYKQYRNWKFFYTNYITSLKRAIRALEKDNLSSFRNEMEYIRKLIQNLSGNLKNYMVEVFRKAQINKASRIYEHGISMEKTARILGISIWELAEYAGKTGIGDVDLSITMPIKQRLALAEEFFK